MVTSNMQKYIPSCDASSGVHSLNWWGNTLSGGHPGTQVLPNILLSQQLVSFCIALSIQRHGGRWVELGSK
jgi:hypothetical protein